MSKLQPEAQLRNAMMDWLRLNRLKCWIHDSMGVWSRERNCYLRRKGRHSVRGLPDIHGVLPGGRFFAIEVKTQTGRVSPEQKQQLAEIAEAGGLAFVARSLKDLEDRRADLGVASGL